MSKTFSKQGFCFGSFSCRTLLCTLPPLSGDLQCLVNGFLLNVSHLVLHFSYFLVGYAQTMSNYVKLCQSNTAKEDHIAGICWSGLMLCRFHDLVWPSVKACVVRRQKFRQHVTALQSKRCTVQRSFRQARQASDSRKGHSFKYLTFEVTSASNVSKRLKIHKRKLRS